MGRSKIRNKLAGVAAFENLLFLDCDSKVKYASFIKNYVKSVKEGADVVYGGRVYSKSKPRSKAKMLHWKYGTLREALSLKKRRNRPYLAFQTNNFLIKRDLFLSIKFDQSIDGYGYEDLVFAQELKKRNVSIHHIENPIEHIDLEKAAVFIKKTENATKNLKKLWRDEQIMPTRLIQWIERAKRIQVEGWITKYFLKRKDAIHANLISDNPNLRNLDLYKAYLFLQEKD